MLETRENFVVAGLITVDGEICPIYVNLDNGDCVFESPVMGTAQLIAEVSIANPLGVTDLRSMTRSLESSDGQYIGIIFRTDGTAVVILDENTAVIRKIDCLMSGGDTFAIDLNSDYDFDEDEDNDM